LGLVALATATAIAACSALADRSERRELTLVAHSAAREAYEAIVPQFVERWEQRTGEALRMYQSYGPSGGQARAVLEGLEADVVALALGADLAPLQAAGLVAPGWRQALPNRAVPHYSVVALATRAGNPQGIRDWPDLTDAGISVVAPNPKTSGGARWTFLALWGAATRQDGMPDPLTYVRRVYGNAPILPRSTREASTVFLQQKQGDVLLTYESVARFAQRSGLKLSYTVPEPNLRADSPVAVVDRHVEQHGNRAVAEAFARYLFSSPAQREFARAGFRPIEPGAASAAARPFPAVAPLLTVTDFGGWEAAQQRFFARGGTFDRAVRRGFESQS